MTLEVITSETIKNMRSIFISYDKDSSGYLSNVEMQKFFKSMETYFTKSELGEALYIIDSNNDRTNPETLLISRDMSNNNSSMDNLSLQSANGNHNLSSNSLNSNNSNSSNKTQFNRPVVHKRKKKKPKTTNNLFPIDNENKKLQGTDIVENESPPEPEPQYIILDLPKDDLPHPSLPLGPPTDEVKESFESKRFLSGIDGLKQRWGEVQFLLRINIEKENNNFDLVHQTSHQSILFLEEMKTMAKEYGVLQGALSQWLMPFDSNTSASDQTSIRRLRKGEHGSRLDEVPDEKRIEMIKKLIDLRKLVKVKIADDNDLDLARRTVIDIDAFCPSIASGTGTPSHGGFLYYEVLEVLQEVSKTHRIIGIDLVEVAPDYDPSGSTSILAAQLLLNLLGFIFDARQSPAAP